MISVIICSNDDAKFTAVADSYNQALNNEPFEIIRTRDAKSISHAYNAASDKANGELVIFSHDDIEILTPRLGDVVRRGLSRYDLIGVAGTTRLVSPSWIGAVYPYVFGQVVQTGGPNGWPFVLQIFNVPTREIGNIEALDGVFMATRRDVLQTRGFDEQTFDGFHLYDIDFSFRCARAGLKVGVVCDIPIIHQSIGQFTETWQMYADRFIRKFPDRDWSAKMPSYQCTIMGVGDKSGLPILMNPPYWAVEP